jgi:hypothetical protein
VRACRVRVSLIVALLLIAGGAVAQDPAVEAALEADQVNQEHCASLFTAQVDRAASATVAVAESWQSVDEIYGQTGAVYLLYWRGALAQCLGRDEAAAADLNSFIESQGGSTMFASLVQSAKTRLRRLGDGASLGQGASASYLRVGPALEIEASWSGGTGFHEIACIDADDATVNVTCIGGSSERHEARAALVPLAAQLAVDGFFTRGFGFGGRAIVHWAAPSGLPDDRSPGATLQLEVGPQMRLLTSVASGGRAGWFRAEARFAASFTQMSPMAGSAKYAWSHNGGYLDPGSWALRHVGVAARVEGAIEIGAQMVLALSGHYAWYAPMAGSNSPQVVRQQAVQLTADPTSQPHEEVVEMLPPLVSTSQMYAGGRVGILLPTKVRSIAIGPFVGVDFLRATMTFPNNLLDCWLYGVPGKGCDSEDLLYRKVFSTRRHDLFVTVGIDGRFGVERKE